MKKREKIFTLVWILFNMLILGLIITFAKYFPYNLLWDILCIPFWILSDRISIKYSIEG